MKSFSTFSSSGRAWWNSWFCYRHIFRNKCMNFNIFLCLRFLYRQINASSICFCFKTVLEATVSSRSHVTTCCSTLRPRGAPISAEYSVAWIAFPCLSIRIFHSKCSVVTVLSLSIQFRFWDLFHLVEIHKLTTNNILMCPWEKYVTWTEIDNVSLKLATQIIITWST